METNRKPRWDMEALVGCILIVGVLASAALLLAGVLWHWAARGSPTLDYSISGTNLLEFWAADIRQAAAGDFRPRLLVNLGIALLLITPFARVLAALLYFAFKEKNLKYACFTAFVLSVLAYSLFLR